MERYIDGLHCRPLSNINSIVFDSDFETGVVKVACNQSISPEFIQNLAHQIVHIDLNTNDAQKLASALSEDQRSEINVIELFTKIKEFELEKVIELILKKLDSPDHEVSTVHKIREITDQILILPQNL